MLMLILIGLGVVISLSVVLIRSRPDSFRIIRSATITAPAETVFEQVNNLRNWQEWSPWENLDPNAKKTFQGPQAGVGAALAWSGNSKVGEGRMAIVQSHPHDRVVFDLEFLKPFKANNVAEFQFTPRGNQTLVKWSMSGENDFVGKLFGMFINCEKMVGAQFEKGLAQMKSLAETTAVAK